MLTDCSHCGATFRVTPAQLGAAGGQVRCGVCAQVFDGFVRLRSEPEPPAAPVTAPMPPPELADAAAAPDSAPQDGPVGPPPPGLATDAPETPAPRGDAEPPLPPTAAAPASAPATEVAPTSGDDEVELAFDAAELDGTLTDIEIPAPAPPAQPEDTLGAGTLAAIEAAAAPPDPGSIDRAVLEDTLTDIEIPTELLELTIADDEPGAAAPQAATASSPERSDPDATLVSETIPGVPGPPAAALPAEAPAEDAEGRLPDGTAAADASGPEPGRDATAAADTEIIPGFPGFVPDDAPGPIPTLPAARPLPGTTSPVRPRRTALIAATVLLAVLLPVQAVFLFRDALADRIPALHPMLDGLCRQAGCRVALPRRTDRLEIETSDLQALDPERPNRVVLIASIRNLAPIAQAYPQLELTLTDPADQPLTRRVFEPTHYLPESVAPDHGFAPRAEVPIRLHLDTGSVTPSGYRILLFHR